ncbi:MAG: hypothetical protein WCA44_18010 [Acidobacteriaceae bacterium]
MTTPPLFDLEAAKHGSTLDPVQDLPRLQSQQKRVEALMADGQWRTLAKIVKEMQRRHGVFCGEAAISARLRDMRRGGWTIERQRVTPKSGLWMYRAAVKAEAAA